MWPGGGGGVGANDIRADEGLDGNAEGEVSGDEVGGASGGVLLSEQLD